MNGHRREPWVLLAIMLAVLVWSGIRPHDRFTWYLEVAPVVLAIPILIWTRVRFPLTTLLYRLLFIHAIILIIGGYYTYARVPLGTWFADLFGMTRNHYDRLGHLAQGFIPAILAREILLRRSPLHRGKWLIYLVLAACVSFSAVFEMIEWVTALISGSQATDYLGTQGDPWDTQWDMFLCMVGASVSLLLLSRKHDRDLVELEKLVARRNSGASEPLEKSVA